MFSSSSSGGGSSVNVRISPSWGGKATKVVTTYTWNGCSIDIEESKDSAGRRVSHYFKCPDTVYAAVKHWCDTEYADMGLIEYLDKVFGDERPVL